MRVFQAVTFRTTSKENVGEVVARVQDAIAAAGESVAPGFYCADSPVGGTAAAARIAKRFPALAALLSSGNLSIGMQGPGFDAISNMDAEWNVTATVDGETAAAIAAGIPRSFPVNAAAFLWPGLKVLTTSGPGTAIAGARPSDRGLGFGYLGPGVVFSSRWWISGRLNTLMAFVEVPPETRPNARLALPRATAAFIAKLGKVEQAVLLPVPGADEVAEVADAAARVRSVLATWRRELAARLASVDFPHVLPGARDLGFRGGETIGPLKAVSVAAFAPLGFKAASGGRGTHVVKKSTPAGSTLEVSIDVGTWSHMCTVALSVRGFGTRASLPVPVNRADIGGAQYPIRSAEQFRTMMENAAAVVRFLEGTFVPEVEAAFGV